MAERAAINQRIQLGAETTPGTNVSAGHLVECLNFNMAIKPVVNTFRPVGRRWANTSEENQEWTEVKIDGNMDYFGMLYLVAGVWGTLTPVTHAGGTTSKDWKWTPPVTGAITPQTFTVEQGDAVRAQKVNYGLMTDFGYKGSRKDFTCTGAMVAQLLQDNITMTSSPTAIPLAPVVGKQVNLFIDTTSGGLGTTQFLRDFTIEYAYTTGFSTFWPLNRANTSFTGHVDAVPKNTMKFTLEADTQGMGLLTHLQAGDTVYLRMDMQGNIIENTIHYAFTHDIALKLTNVDPFSDVDGVYAIGYQAEIIEDSAWGASGTSQILTITNTLTAL